MKFEIRDNNGKYLGVVNAESQAAAIESAKKLNPDACDASEMLPTQPKAAEPEKKKRK